MGLTDPGAGLREERCVGSVTLHGLSEWLAANVPEWLADDADGQSHLGFYGEGGAAAGPTGLGGRGSVASWSLKRGCEPAAFCSGSLSSTSNVRGCVAR
jgi:hypothetical protein